MTQTRPENPPRRITRQRSALEALLAELEDFRSAQDLHALLRDRGDGVGLATVYRTLQALVEEGQVDVLRGDDGEASYRSCSPVHHHHLVCRSCRRTVEVADPPLERWAQRIAAEHGFADVHHQLEVYGTCGACAP
ncbi:Fur family transcriptional regulator [Blastococcus saxobsidens]|uniref:Fur family ferric uptake transcriptional regulator n=1 Tax=Blastococcus saxobsidens TaxID=138336 RepID=A0A4Q7Y8S9_9ACTN|nr:Fur family transcriptional regulator [Blastococcus saxobsidens]RZU33507.1 Fur family ferric uptake transcriptional regulator [Blastococcus saxobsidens]